jgi:thioredoxin-related protein
MMKRRTLAVLALATLITILTATPGLLAAQSSSGGIQWLDYAEGRQRSAAENKKVFLIFEADWCRYCLQMEKETFQDPTVIAYVNRNFVPIRVDSDRQQDIASAYGVRGLPSTWFIAADGNRIVNRPGYIAADELLHILKYIGSDSYLTMSFKDFVENSP